MKKEKRAAKTEARRARFERERAALLQSGLKERDCTIERFGAAAALILLPIAAAIAVYIWLAREANGTLAEWLCLPIAAVLSVPAHELLHALGWGIANGGFRGIGFGFDAKTRTPYCACALPMTRAKYLFGTLFPFAALGIVPAALGIAFARLWLLIFSLINLFLAGGDAAVAFYALFRAGRGAVLLDHPERAGFYAFTKSEGRAK